MIGNFMPPEMKKRWLLLFFTITMLGVNAQEVGIRFGGASGYWGAAVDGVFDAGVSRIHANLGIYNRGVEADVLWHLIYKPMPWVESVSGYVGIGSSMRFANPFLLGVAGEVGLEYRFATLPLVVGADWRPTFWLIENTEFEGGRWGIMARWNFGAKSE